MPLLINHFYRFGEFTLDADQRVLLRQGKPLLLAPKVLETLMTLVRDSGRIIDTFTRCGAGALNPPDSCT